MLKGILLFSTEHETKGAFGTEAVISYKQLSAKFLKSVKK